nr:histidine kinase [Absiella sp. AM09-45]
MYIIINHHTLQKYNATYTAYNQLNKFYTNVKLMNDSFQGYLYNPSDENYQLYKDAKKESYQNLENIQESLDNMDIEWRFTSLRNMLDAYVKQADIVKKENMQPNDTFNEAYETLTTYYALIDHTNADSYGYLTQDMQVQKSAVHKYQQIVQLVTLFLLLYVSIWMVYFSITTLRSLTDPIDKIIKNMNRIKQGTYDLTQISNVNTEMNALCIELEDMAGRVQENISYAKEKAELEKRVLEQQNENLKKDELLAQSELKILQNQINPHFLFNTLNMIYKMAYQEGAMQTSELMEKTSQLLRYGLDSANKISDLHKELKAIENYNYIQEKRYGGRIHFLIEQEEDVENIAMPSMILQPLVENAVTHGLKDVTEDGEVSIEVGSYQDEVIISIADNGVGISPQKLEKLILNDFQVDEDERSHLGLYNVTKRLKAFFHDRVKIIVDSDIDCGFEITIRIREGEDV